MTLRDLIRELQEIDQKYLDSEIVVAMDDRLDGFYLNPVVGTTADARIGEPRVTICPGDDSETIAYEDMFDRESDDNNNNQDNDKDNQEKQP